MYTNEVRNPDTDAIEIKVTHGTEIVREVTLCDECGKVV